MRCRLNSWRSQALLLSSAVLVLPLCGCGYIVKSKTHQLPLEPANEITLNLHRMRPFLDCLQASGGKCPAVPSRPGAAEATGATPGFFAGQPYPPPPQKPFDARPAYSEKYPTDAELQAGVRGATATPLDKERLATRTAAKLAYRVLQGDVQKELHALFQALKGGCPDSVVATDNTRLFQMDCVKGTATMNLPLKKFAEYQDAVGAATRAGGWEALARETRLYPNAFRDDQERMYAYLASYFAAYFRHGQFFRAKINTSELDKQLLGRLQALAPGLADYKGLLGSLSPQLQVTDEGAFVLGKVQDSGFVSRGGQSFAMPVLETSLTLGTSEFTRPELDYIAVGRDLIRVLLHAVFDAEMRLPAVSTATGAKDPCNPPSKISVAPPPPAAPACPLEVNDPTTNVDDEEFGRIETAAATWEGVTSAGVGRLIRGASFFSLNNEALATAIETAVGMAVRKPIEKVYWCWYACKLNEPNQEVGQFVATSFGEPLTLRISVTDRPDDMQIEKKK